MAFFRRLFGKKPPDHKPKQLLRAIRKFVEAKTWSESKRTMEQHPELLSDKADAFLKHHIAEKTDEDVIQVLTQHRELLRRCRDVGLDAAFAHLIGVAAATVRKPTVAYSAQCDPPSRGPRKFAVRHGSQAGFHRPRVWREVAVFYAMLTPALAGH